jgi:hypothetical protein
VLPPVEAERWIQAGHVGDVAWEALSALDRAYPEGTLGVTWDVERQRSWSYALLVVAAGVAAAGAVALTFLDLTDPPIERWLAHHNWTNQMVGSLVVVLATYVIVDRVLDRRRAARWLAVAEHPILDYVRELAEFRTAAHELGQITILAVDLEDGREALLQELEEDFQERRAEVLRRFPILNDRRSALTIFFSAIPELANLLPTQLRIDRYVSLTSHALADLGSSSGEYADSEGVLESWPAFKDAFNLHIVGIHDIFGSSELDEFFEEPEERGDEVVDLPAPRGVETTDPSEEIPF